MNQPLQESSMDDSIPQSNTDDIDEKNGLFNNHHTFLGFRCEDDLLSQNFLTNLVKHSLLLGAEKLLMARKSPRPLALSNFDPQEEYESNTSQNRKLEDNCSISRQNKNARPRYKAYATQSSSVAYNKEIECSNVNHSVVVSKMMNYPSESYNDFPLNVVSFLAVLVLKLAGFQIGLFLRFFTFPIWLFNFWLMFLMFPFQTLARIRDHARKKLLKAVNSLYSRLISFICNRFSSQKTMLKLAVRFGKALIGALYVFSVLVGLLVSGFVVSGFVMKSVVEEPIHTTDTLNFDYTKPSPVAIVPITSSVVKDKAAASESLGQRPIPYNHKLQLTVSLTLPESEYNRKLGIFQVRVESLSSSGKVIAGSSYPTMLRFKSQPIRVIETLFNSVPLLTGLQSEVQNLKIVVREFTEGYEPTSSFKVILEQRAEFQSGSGVPEIYTASLDIASELPQLKKVVWKWRLTIFVWVGICSFVGEMMVVLLFCRPIILLNGRSKNVESKKKFQLSKIAWQKTV